MPPCDSPLRPDVLERLRETLRRVPARAVAQRCGCSLTSVLRAAAGMPILRGTAALIERGLA